MLPLLSWAQTPLLNFDFDGGFQGWVPVSVECNGVASEEAKWTWVADGSTEQGIYSSGFGQLDSRTPDNGIVILNSEFLDNQGLDNNLGNGPCPSPQVAELISPSLDFANQSEVYMSFSQLYLRFQGYTDQFGATSTYVAVTTDGTTWTEIPINESVAILRTNTIEENEVTLDLTSYLAGKSNVQVKFLWRGDYYFWGVDDVRFFDSKVHDLAISAFKYPVGNYETPESMITSDTMTFIADVTNNGSSVVDSAYLRVSVRSNTANSRLYFTDSVLVENLMPGDTIEVSTPNIYVPTELTEGTYLFIYSFRNVETVEEINGTNNLAADFFRVSQGNYRKTDRGDNIYYTNPDEVPFIIGNFYKTNPFYTGRIVAKKITFSNFTPDNSTLAGKEVILKLYKISDDVKDDLSNLDITSENNETIKTIGIGTYTYTSADDDLSTLDRFSADLYSFTNLDSAVVLDPGSRYIAAIQYAGSSIGLGQHLGRRIRYYSGLGSSQIATVIFDNNIWSMNNPFGDAVAIIGLDVEADVTTANELELSEAEVNIFPNPASDYINVELSLNNPQTISTFLTDVTGKILVRKSYDNFVQGTVRFEVSQYPAGTYFVRLDSEQGVKVKKIVVGH